MDRFLEELNRVYFLRANIENFTHGQHKDLAQTLGNDYVTNWIFQARDSQLPPHDLDWCWLFLGGRGTGKSHSMSASVHIAVRAGIKRIHTVSPTTADAHDVMLEGPSGILRTAPRNARPRWVASRRRLEWPNGAQCVMFSGEEPDSLRGPQCELCIIDEIARMRYQGEVFDMAFLGLRLGDRPRMFLATTPRPTPFMKKLVQREGVTITSGTTYDNAKHLSPPFLAKVRELYEGTRLGRQELMGGLILDPISALFKDDWIHYDDVPEELIEQTTVGVDPSGGTEDVGIVVCALLNDGRLGVLADRTISASPGKWGDEVVRAHDEFKCDDVVVEINFGGQMASDVVREAARRASQAGNRPDDLIRVREVSASRGKVMRAEPVSLLYEKGRVVHRRGLDQLEQEMLSFSREWDRAVDGSPNRLDAMVWGISRLSRIQTDVPIA